MRRISKYLLTFAFALVTSILTACVLVFVERQLHFAIYAFTFWLVFPVGALASGALSASGYSLAFWLFPSRPPGKLFAAVVIATSIASYFLIYYVAYSTLEVKGKSISVLMPFGTYLTTVIENRHLSFNFSDLGSPGPFNYVLAAIQIAGFVLGGSIIVGRMAAAVPCCDKCDGKLAPAGTFIRRANSLLSLEEVHQKAFAALMAGHSGQARQMVVDQNPPPNPAQKLALSIWKCSRCPVEFFDLSITPSGQHVGRKRNYCHIREASAQSAS